MARLVLSKLLESKTKVSKMKNVLVVLVVGLLGMSCVADTGPEIQEGDLPCGIMDCSATLSDENLSDPAATLDSKADTQGVRAAIVDLSADGELDTDDVELIFDEAGRNVSRKEMDEIRTGVIEANSYEVGVKAMTRANELALTSNLSEAEGKTILDGETFAETKVPDAVSALILRARLEGAEVYDVNEVDSDGEQVWSPYPATTPARENMTFEYTEITPDKLLADLDAVDEEYQMITGTESVIHSSGQEYKQVTYRDATGGTGNISAQYDEVYHPDIYARGSSRQKWANNMAILSDGTIHCLPASRRSFLQDLILTNPHLSRGKHMMFNGHLDVREGVVVGVEMSGRLSKLAAKGKARFIDPIALLEAWGFEISPNVSLRYGNTRHGTPVQEDGVIKK